jgi:S-adenosylmethionine:tRNA ribosyltransferase-isomerase
MKLSQFTYNLPANLIAQDPIPRREDARMLVVHKKTGVMEHKHFKDILEYFDERDVFVVNNTKVFPARLYGRKEKTGAKIEVFLLRELNKANRLWDVIVEPARKIRVGNKLYFGDDNSMVAEVVDNTTSRGRTIRFLWDDDNESFKEALYALGETPLPRYIKRKPDDIDKERFQTVYAKVEGAVVPPTAGMHFSRELIKRAEIHGIKFAEITLHTSLGTFRPIEVEDLSKHKIDAEYFNIDDYAVKTVNTAKENSRNVCAIGATSLRAVECSTTSTGMLKPQEGWNNMFIHPPYDFQICNSLLTNFHIPKTSLFIMTCSFLGYDLTMEAYELAIKEKYQFFSYGDCMLIVD